MLTVSMTVSHLYQNLKIVKGVAIIAINAQSHSIGVTPSPPWLGDEDHLCPYGRKLIGSLIPVHSRSSVWSDTYAFLDPSLKLIAFLLNYLNFFPMHYVIVLTDVVCYGWFMVLIGRSSAGGSCEIRVGDLFCFLSVFCNPGTQLSTCFTDVYLFTFRVACSFVHHSSLFFFLSTLSFGWTKTCLRVVLGLTTVATMCFVNIRCIFSVNEWTYGTVTYCYLLRFNE